MKFPKELTTVTPLSKTFAFLLFIFLPIIAFIVGMNYEQQITSVMKRDTVSISTYPKTKVLDEQTLQFFGTISRLQRPAADIAYDYQLLLDHPYLDTNNASGLPQHITSVVLISSDPNIQIEFERKINNKVIITGSWEWGYSESKVFRVISVSAIPSDWKRYVSDKKDFSFSLYAPKNMYVHFCPFASFGGYCEGEEGYVGVYMKESDFPYGLVIEQTILLGLTDKMARNSFPENYTNAVPSDIDFGDQTAVMKQGKDTEDIHGVGVFKDYIYTKYTFKKGNYLYMVSIRTDENLTNFDLLKHVLETWKFE